MKFLAVPMLAALLAPAGDDAAKSLKALEDKVARADIVQATFDVKFEAGKITASTRGTFTVAAGNKARVDLVHEVMGVSQKDALISDGMKSVLTRDGKPQPSREYTKNLRSALTVFLARSGLSNYFFGPGPLEWSERDPLEVVKVINPKQLKVEKVDGRDAVAIEYNLDTTKITNVTYTGTVWVDLKTHLPLKRVIRLELSGQPATITETYSNVRLNPKLAPDFFQLPK
jgi:outer membrane lipoprotein-sorting protein